MTTAAEAHPPGDLPIISHDELLRRLADPTLRIVNVLGREAYAEQHIPGSLNLPVADLLARAGRVLPDRAAEIAVYCASPT